MACWVCKSFKTHIHTHMHAHTHTHTHTHIATEHVNRHTHTHTHTKWTHARTHTPHTTHTHTYTQGCSLQLAYCCCILLQLRSHQCNTVIACIHSGPPLHANQCWCLVPLIFSNLRWWCFSFHQLAQTLYLHPRWLPLATCTGGLVII